MRLLVDRVRDGPGGFELTGDNAPALTELCRRLGGLPLALELAAAWMRVLTPDQLLTDLYARAPAARCPGGPARPAADAGPHDLVELRPAAARRARTAGPAVGVRARPSRSTT